jgi:molybdenum cofactor cytidylyltransferase
VKAGTITTVVLAAGASTRLGRPKQLVEVEGTPLVVRAARTALDADLGPVIVVLGAGADAVEPSLQRLDIACTRNARWQEGMGTSIAAGVEAAAADPRCDAVILMTCDQPRVLAGHLGALATAWRSGHGDAVGSAYGGSVGIPALFARSRFAALSALAPRTGAKALLADAASVPCEACAVDVDTPDDLIRF